MFSPGEEVIVLVDTWMAPAGSVGVVHTENLTEGLISVQYQEDYGQGIFDFDPAYLEKL